MSDWPLTFKGHVRRFLRRPLEEKRMVLRFRVRTYWRRYLPRVPIPMRLPFGAWWLSWNDGCGDMVYVDQFEPNDWRFVDRFLRPGMTFVDVGAHHGFYTLLASRRVGPQGRVMAVEPSPAERAKLMQHLRLNRTKNVEVIPLALSASSGEAVLFIFGGRENSLNSLRKPISGTSSTEMTVQTCSLDELAREKGWRRIDMIKIDVEGGERDVLKGAAGILRRSPPPLVMLEMLEQCTAAWGYHPSDIYRDLHSLGYEWFSIDDGCRLAPCSIAECAAHWNLVAAHKDQIESDPLASFRVT